MDRIYPLAADAMMFLHFAFTAFVIVGPILVFLGRRNRWDWVHGFWFRSLHLGSIIFVLGESLLAIECPLTVWEHWFRRQAGQDVTQTEFISHWTEQWFGFRTPPWTLTVVFTCFATFVLWTWWKVPPEPPPWEDENSAPPPLVETMAAEIRRSLEPEGTGGEGSD